MPIWQVTDDHAVGFAARLVQHNQVGEIVLAALANQTAHFDVSAIDALRVWHHQFHLFCKDFQPDRGIARCRHHELEKYNLYIREALDKRKK